MNKFLCGFMGVFLVAGMSCKEIFEPSISKKNVQLLAPGDQYRTADYEIGFWFEPVEDALYYRLQVVSPSFDSIGSLVLDTLIQSNKFFFTINPGEYQWRVQAENGSSKTPFSSFRSFSVNLSSISQQKVTLISPGNGALTNNSPSVFKWALLFGANQYRFQLDTNNFADENSLVFSRLGPASEITASLPRDQVYQWRVRAENDTARSQWSAINQIIYDTTPPARVSLKSPAKEQSLNLPLTLEWNPVATARRYKLLVLKSDSTTVFDNKYPMVLNTTSYVFNQGSGNERIYWKVSAIDEAGNEGEFSELRNFIIQ